MSQSATPATRNDVARRLNLLKVTTFAALPKGTAIANSHGRWRTVANGCEMLRMVADGCASGKHTVNPQSLIYRVKQEPLLHIKQNCIWSTNLRRTSLQDCTTGTHEERLKRCWQRPAPLTIDLLKSLLLPDKYTNWFPSTEWQPALKTFIYTGPFHKLVQCDITFAFGIQAVEHFFLTWTAVWCNAVGMLVMYGEIVLGQKRKAMVYTLEIIIIWQWLVWI